MVGAIELFAQVKGVLPVGKSVLVVPAFRQAARDLVPQLSRQLSPQ